MFLEGMKKFLILNFRFNNGFRTIKTKRNYLAKNVATKEKKNNS